MKYVIVLMVLVSSFANVRAQNEEKEVIKVVNRLFEGMKQADSAMVHSAFADNPQLYTAFTNKDGKPMLHKGDLQGFLNAVGSPHDQVWNEPIWNIKVQIDGNLASVWTDYAFYVGNTFSHCGVDAFHLFKSEEGWQIFHLTDTRRQSGCEVPDEIKSKFEN